MILEERSPWSFLHRIIGRLKIILSAVDRMLLRGILA